MNKTVFSIKKEKNYTWFLFDAESKTLGRLSTEISRVLTGKNDVQYNSSQNIYHGVIVINAEKITVTGKKETDKFSYKTHARRLSETPTRKYHNQNFSIEPPSNTKNTKPVFFENFDATSGAF